MTNMVVVPDSQQDLIQVVARHPQFPFAAVSALTVSEATQLILHLKHAIADLDTRTLCQRVSTEEKSNDEAGKEE